MTPKVSCIWVCLYKRFSTTFGFTSLFNSTTIATLLSDSSLRSETPQFSYPSPGLQFFLLVWIYLPDRYFCNYNSISAIIYLFYISFSPDLNLTPTSIIGDRTSFIPRIIPPVGKSGSYLFIN